MNYYDPMHYLRDDPAAVYQLAHPQEFNFVIPLSTHVEEPNPYTDRAWLALQLQRGVRAVRAPRAATPEEIGRQSFDIDWRWVGTRGD